MVSHGIHSRTRASTDSLAWSNEFRPFAVSTSTTFWDDVVGGMGGSHPVDYSQDVVPSDYVDQIETMGDRCDERCHSIFEWTMVVVVVREGGWEQRGRKDGVRACKFQRQTDRLEARRIVFKSPIEATSNFG